MAFAIMCSECCSMPAVMANSFSSDMYAMMSVTPNFPSVKVPVLSKTTASTSLTISNAFLSLIRMPFLAVMEVESAITSGIASPRACGQAITRTVTDLSKAGTVG
jgi:hypothetical protein